VPANCGPSPRLAELYPGLEVTPWLALFAPAAVPAPVLARLRSETGRLLADPEMREKVRHVGGLEPYVTSAEEFAALLRAEYAKYGQIVKAVGAKID
jgi:tripartite-type tricarboxylate transporter receptor subunit TctC